MSEILIGVFGLVLAFFFPNFLYLILGLIFSRSDKPRTHFFGVRCLAMCMLVSSRFVASHCHMSCDPDICRNWTCANYTSCSSSDSPEDPG